MVTGDVVLGPYQTAMRELFGAVHIVHTHENVENWIPPFPMYAIVRFTTVPTPLPTPSL